MRTVIIVLAALLFIGCIQESSNQQANDNLHWLYYYSKGKRDAIAQSGLPIEQQKEIWNNMKKLQYQKLRTLTDGEELYNFAIMEQHQQWAEINAVIQKHKEGKALTDTEIMKVMLPLLGNAYIESQNEKPTNLTEAIDTAVELLLGPQLDIAQTPASTRIPTHSYPNLTDEITREQQMLDWQMRSQREEQKQLQEQLQQLQWEIDQLRHDQEWNELRKPYFRDFGQFGYQYRDSQGNTHGYAPGVGKY